MNNHQLAIELRNVSKQYTIHHEKPTLVEKFTKGKNENFWALKNINLTIKRGERVGIIGPNGSGKTTLLKIISGITTPTTGTVKTYGKVVSVIDLQAGFHPDLSGYQNLFLNGILLGMKNEEIKKETLNIIEFADIKQFIDAPLYTYSSGMMLRLGFAVAAYSNPSIIIVDETINVGDSQFQKKIWAWMDKFIKNGNTFILTSHSDLLINSVCSRIINLNYGIITKSALPKMANSLLS